MSKQDRRASSTVSNGDISVRGLVSVFSLLLEADQRELNERAGAVPSALPVVDVSETGLARDEFWWLLREAYALKVVRNNGG